MTYSKVIFLGWQNASQFIKRIQNRRFSRIQYLPSDCPWVVHPNNSDFKRFCDIYSCDCQTATPRPQLHHCLYLHDGCVHSSSCYSYISTGKNTSNASNDESLPFTPSFLKKTSHYHRFNICVIIGPSYFWYISTS